MGEKLTRSQEALSWSDIAPGPWQWGDIHASDDLYRRPALSWDGGTLFVCHENYLTDKEQRMIAASPEMHKLIAKMLQVFAHAPECNLKDELLKLYTAGQAIYQFIHGGDHESKN